MINELYSRLIFIAVICFISFGFQSNGCNPKDERINVMSPTVKGELVFFYKKGTDWEQILEFGRTVIGTPSATGFSSLPGMMTVVSIKISGYDGKSINFQPNATDAEKAFVKKRVLESPIVYKVYENVVPNEIKDLN